MPLVVFVCTGNTCRSPMAEGFFKQQWAGVEAASAGTTVFPGAGPAPEAVTAAASRGTDILSHRAQEISRALISRADLVIAMTRFHAEWVKRCFPESGEKVATLGELARQDAFLDVPDPVGQSLQVYQQVADLIRQLLEDARKEIEKRIKI